MACQKRFARVLRLAVVAVCFAPAIARGGDSILQPRTFDVETFDAGATEEAARTGSPINFHFFGKSHRIVLEPSEVRSRDFHEQAGSTGDLRTVYSQAARTFKGHLVDEPESVVRLSRGRNGLRGYVKSSEGWTFIEPLASAGTALSTLGVESGSGQHKVYTEDDIDTSFLGHCAEPVTIESGDPGSRSPGSNVGANDPITSPAQLRVLELAIDADVEFYAIYGADSTTEIESIVNMVDGIYEAELGITIQIVSLNVWQSEPDPYTSTDSGSLLGELRTEWNSEQGAITRDATHLFTGKELDGSTVGIAYVSVVCSTSVSYALSQDLASDVLMPLLVAHEIGHNLGANHDASGSSPRYVMYPSLGFSNLDEFSTLSKTDIADYVDGVSCLALDGGGVNISDPPPGGGNGGGGGGGGPVDPVLLVILGGGALAWKSMGGSRRPRKDIRG